VAVVAANMGGVAGTIVVRWLVFDVVVGVVVDIAGDSRWLWLRYQVCITVSYF